MWVKIHIDDPRYITKDDLIEEISFDLRKEWPTLSPVVVEWGDDE